MHEKKEADFPGPSFLMCAKLEPLPYRKRLVPISIWELRSSELEQTASDWKYISMLEYSWL